MRSVFVLGLLCGLALLTALLLHFGLGDILHAVGAIGWDGFALIVGVHLCLIAVMGSGWWVLALGRADTRWWKFAWGRLMRESASEALPLSQIGGFVLGARAATLAGVAGAFAAASMVVDVTVEMVSQLGYTLLGIALLWWVKPESDLLAPVAAAACAMALLASGFVVVQRRGTATIERMLARIAQSWTGGRGGNATTAHIFIHQLHGRPRLLALSWLAHFAAWLLNGAEAWLTFHLIGVPIGFAEALIIDSFLYAIRSAVFFVPNALGVQEGSYIMLGALFGVAPDDALALSLIRRGRDLLIGVPTLLTWQALEGRRALAKPREAEGCPGSEEPERVPFRP